MLGSLWLLPAVQSMSMVASGREKRYLTSFLQFALTVGILAEGPVVCSEVPIVEDFIVY